MPEINRRSLLGAAGLSLAALSEGASTHPAAAAIVVQEPTFELGTVTYNVPKDWDLSTLLKTLPAAGVKAIEFRTTHAHGVEPAMPAAQRAELKSRAKDAGLVLWGLGTVCEFQSPDPSIVRRQIETCHQFVQLAKDTGIKGVKIRPNGLPDGVPVEKTIEQIGRALAECGKFASDHGVEIWMEVHGKGTQDPPHARKIMDICGHSSVGVCWNSNPTDVVNGSVKESFALLRPFLKSCHINNLWGPYPYRELFRLMRETGYDRYTLCEVATPVKPEDGALFFQCYRGLWKELARG